MKSRWKQVVLWTSVGVLVALLAVAGGSYLWFHNQVAASNKRVDPAIVQALNEVPTTTTTSTSPNLAIDPPSTTTVQRFDTPTGMNIVLVGCDKRAEGSKEITEGRSDTIILAHVDTEQGFLSLLSVPRDLLADVPGHGLYKINAAYAFGGGALLIRTIQSELGVDLDHYIGVDLEAFKAITKALGGVYMDVDRRYLNDSYSWEHIDLQPGYQLLNPDAALDYVRFRHDDNIDFGRMARQQQFLSAVREQALGWNLTLKLPSLVKALFANVDTDMGANDLIRLAYWAARLDGSRIKRAEITAHTGIIHGVFYVLPTDEEVAVAVKDFFTAPAPAAAPATGAPTLSTSATAVGSPARPTLSPANLKGVRVDVVNATGRVGQAAFLAVWISRQGGSVTTIREAEQALIGGAKVRYPAGRARAAETVAQALGIEQMEQTRDVDRVTVVLGTSYLLDPAQLAGSADPVPDLSKWRSLAATAGLALQAPTYLPDGLSYSFERSYDLATGGQTKPAVRVGYRYDSKDLYVGVSASTWLEAPLASPGIQVHGDGVLYTLVATSDKADHVWWVRNGVLNWVSNTLFSDLTREELLAIAVSMVPVPEVER